MFVSVIWNPKIISLLNVSSFGSNIPSFIDNVMYSDSDVISTIYPPLSLQYDFAAAKLALLSSANRYHLLFAIFFQGGGHVLLPTNDK